MFITLLLIRTYDLGVKLVTVTHQRMIEKGCRRCSKPFILREKVIATNRASGGNSGTNTYHIQCAREVHLTVAEVWWNRLTKYKRKTILIDLDLDPVDIEENHGLAYRLLSEEIKIQVDVRYYQK